MPQKPNNMKLILKHKCCIHFLLLCITYIIAFVVGMSYGVDEPTPNEAINLNANIPEIQMSNSYDIFLSISNHNLYVSLKFFISGLFSLGIFPLALSFYNGFIFGNITGSSTHILCSNDIICATLPHIFEFIGLNLFGTIGFYISFEYITNQRFPQVKKILLLTSVALSIVILAALSESYISIQI